MHALLTSAVRDAARDLPALLALATLVLVFLVS